MASITQAGPIPRVGQSVVISRNDRFLQLLWWYQKKHTWALRPSAEWSRSHVWPALSMGSQKSTLIWSQDGWPHSQVPRLQSLRNHSGLFAAGSELVGFFSDSFHSATSWKVNFLLQAASKENKWRGKGKKSPSGL